MKKYQLGALTVSDKGLQDTKEEMDYMADTVIRMAEGRIWEGESV